MSAQRHVIKRQTVEITLAKKTQAWELQQALSLIFQRRVPELLDRCLSEAGSSDYLHRIDRLELDLGELDSHLLETELLERIEKTLRQALSEEIEHRQSLPVGQQQSNPVPAHLELFEHFLHKGYLPWWAESSQRELPEKTLAALLNTDPEALKYLLPRLIREPQSLQRLIGYFGDGQLIAIIALLTAAPTDSVTALLQILSAVQAPLHQHSRMPTAHLRATLWQSLLQVAIANEPPISRHDEFLAAVAVRWAKLQGLPQPILTSYFKQLLSSQTPIDNQWLQAIKLLMLKERMSVTSVEQAVERSEDVVNPPKIYRYQLAPSVISSKYAMRRRHHFILVEPDIELASVDEIIVAGSGNTSISLEEGQGEGVQDSPIHDNPQYGSFTDYRRRLVPSASKTGRAILDKPISPQAEPENGSFSAGRTSRSLAVHRRPVSAAISNRYSKLKSITGARYQRARENKSEPLAGDRAAKRTEHSLDDALSMPAEKDIGEAYGFSQSLPLEDVQGELFQKSKSREHRQHSTPENQSNNRPAFSDADAVYINNAGLCMLWPFLGAFFERLDLMQNGQFHDQAAKQCAASLLHYVVYEELNPPEYMLPFNKLLCGMPIDNVFDLATPLTTAQTVACDELLEAVVGNAPILNKMSVNGFRGSFLLRQGSLSASEGSWLLRVERETYDLVLERFPWSWQWFKLPWMEYPMRVEW